MKRIGIAVMSILASVPILVPGTVSAAAPTIESIAGTTDLGNLNEGPAGDVCAFDVGAVVVAGPGARSITFDGPRAHGATTVLVGPLKVTLTNLDTDASMTVAIPGPTFLDGSGFPIAGTGPWVIFEPIAEGGLRYIRGRLAFEAAPYGVHALVLAGTERDLCDALA